MVGRLVLPASGYENGDLVAAGRPVQNDGAQEERAAAATAAAIARVQIVAGNILVRLATQMEWETDGTPLLDEVTLSFLLS